MAKGFPLHITKHCSYCAMRDLNTTTIAASAKLQSFTTRALTASLTGGNRTYIATHARRRRSGVRKQNNICSSVHSKMRNCSVQPDHLRSET